MNQQPHHPASSLNFFRQGSGEPLLLLHGLGGNIASWGVISADLTKTYEIIAVALSGPIVPQHDVDELSR